MMDKVKEWSLWLWDWAKRIFGRSKIIFLQVVGIFATVWLEVADPLAMFDWDQVVDKHEAAIALQIGIQMLTASLRAFASNGPASFSALPPPAFTGLPNGEDDLPPYTPDVDQRSPKAD